MGLVWHSELTLESFRSFCEETISQLYLDAYSATVNEKRADQVVVNTLCATFAARNILREDESSITPEQAVNSTLIHILSNTERSRLSNDLFALGKERLPSEDHLSALIDKAQKQAEIEMPRYAPVFSGVKGTLYVLSIVVCIIACVIVVWNGSLNGMMQPDGSSGEKIYAVSGERANSLLLVEPDVVFEENYAGNSIVKFTVSGADAAQVRKVDVYSPEGMAVKTYNCNDNYTCFASSGDQYRLVILGNNGTSITRFVNTGDKVSGSDVLPQCLVFVHDTDTYVIKTDVSATDVSQSDVKSVTRFNAPGVSGYELVTGTKNAGTFYLESDGAYSFTAAKGFTGTDMITVKLTMNDGSSRDITVPVIVVNNAPTYTAPLLFTVKHTPSQFGKYIGKLTANDSDAGDAQKLVYSLISADNCDVMISKNGGYVVGFDDTQRGREDASFVFEVSDGLLKNRYTMSFRLDNNLIDTTSFRKDVYCFSGENGYYDLELPGVDKDGDPIYWSVNGTVTGKTERGTEYKNDASLSALYVRIDPALDEEAVEVLDLICSDGWMEMHIRYQLDVHKNPAPTFKTTTAHADAATNLAVCTIDWECACELNSYRIIDGQGVAGSVVKSSDWDDMTFRFIPDGTGAPASAVLTIEEVSSGKTYKHTVTITQDY